MKECMLMGTRDGGLKLRKSPSFAKEGLRRLCGSLRQRIKEKAMLDKAMVCSVWNILNLRNLSVSRDADKMFNN